MTESTELLDTARALGSWCWLQARTFSLVGGWVQWEPDPEVKIQFFAHSRRKGGHAVALAGLLPAIAGSRTTGFVVPSGEDRELVAGLEAAFVDGDGTTATGTATTALRLAALYGNVAPREVAALRSFLTMASPAGAMPVIRVVAAILADEEHDLRVGAGLLAARRKGTG